MTDNGPRRLCLGALVDPIGVQVPELPKKVVAIFQKDMEQITRLYIRDIISTSEQKKAYARLAKMIKTDITTAGQEK